MADHLIHLPTNFKYLNQFAPSQYAHDPSKMRCGSATSAMVAEIAYPGRWIPEQLEHDLYVKWAGPDVASDPNGVSKEEILKWLSDVGIGHVDMTPLVDEWHKGNQAPLHSEIMAQNAQSVCQILTVADESYLYQAVPSANGYVDGPRLHNWVDAHDPNHTVYSHVFLRVGFSDNEGYGLYYEPAAPGFAQPVKIMWNDIAQGGIMTCIGIMPYGVSAPPQGFSYTKGVWPTPKPVLNLDAVTKAFTDYKAASDRFKQESDAAFLQIVAALGAKI